MLFAILGRISIFGTEHADETADYAPYVAYLRRLRQFDHMLRTTSRTFRLVHGVTFRGTTFDVSFAHTLSLTTRDPSISACSEWRLVVLVLGSLEFANRCAPPYRRGVCLARLTFSVGIASDWVGTASSLR